MKSFKLFTEELVTADLLEGTYEIAKQIQSGLEADAKKHAATLNAFPRGHMNLTPDHVKATPEWKMAKQHSNNAHAALQNFNSKFTKQYKKELAADRLKRRT